MATAFPPSALISSATLRALSRTISTTATDAPRRANSFARPMPIPFPPPVTTAALPLNSVIVIPYSQSIEDFVPLLLHIEEQRTDFLIGEYRAVIFIDLLDLAVLQRKHHAV